MDRISVTTKGNKNKIIYNDKIEKSSFLNSVYISAEHNRKLINDLNNVYRTYVVNSKMDDIVLYNNISNMSHETINYLKMKLKNSEKLLKEFDEKYIFNIDKNDVEMNNSETLKVLMKNKNDGLLNISNIKQKIKKIDNINNINITDRKNTNSANNRNKRNIKYQNSKNFSSIISRRNSFKDFLLISKDIKKISKKMKKIDKLSNLYEQINGYIRNQLMSFKDDNKKRTYSSYREKIDQKRPRSTYVRNRNILSIQKNQKSNKRVCSAIFNRTKKIILKKNNNNISNRTNTTNTKNKLTHNFSDISNALTSAKTRRKINYSISSNNNSLTYKKQTVESSPLLFSTRIKNRNILCKKKYKTKKQIGKIAFKTINEAIKINNVVKKNYSSHKQPKLKIEKEDSNDHKINLSKIRSDLKLRDTNGLLGKINEINIVEKSLKNMSERLSQKKLNILIPIVRGTIRTDLILNKKLIYNVGIENKINRDKYFKLYNILTKLKTKNKLIENFVLN